MVQFAAFISIDSNQIHNLTLIWICLSGSKVNSLAAIYTHQRLYTSFVCSFQIVSWNPPWFSVTKQDMFTNVCVTNCPHCRHVVTCPLQWENIDVGYRFEPVPSSSKVCVHVFRPLSHRDRPTTSPLTYAMQLQYISMVIWTWLLAYSS